jgi:hypothetical protein
MANIIIIMAIIIIIIIPVSIIIIIIIIVIRIISSIEIIMTIIIVALSSYSLLSFLIEGYPRLGAVVVHTSANTALHIHSLFLYATHTITRADFSAINIALNAFMNSSWL